MIFPSDPLRPRRPDEHFAAEAAAARDLGETVALVDHDALARGDADQAVRGVPAGEAVYRGWMLSADRYAQFAAALEQRDARLRTTAADYRRAHELPGWYAALTDVTPASAWTRGDGRDEFDAARARLGPGAAVLRDYSKSMKHHWHEAMYIPDTGDEAAAWRVASRFRALREDEFAGGFVLRAFENFASAEVRTWWRDGRQVLCGAHPDTPADLPPEDLDTGWLAPRIAALALPFVTADLVRRADGTWRVVEIGDGQVSDRPVSLDATEFLAAIR
ncbi:ATP-grasp domain-containing protein [Hamadaea tsunoensis]|uniref:ATP-grasp domain-containing protein n=1 Tax=Hamadaea tsunoensis TaxID=53368 RepID=UPI001B7FDB5C|nr:ATP-grasp domain-containing protein [Hamadaea tsunoensis]